MALRPYLWVGLPLAYLNIRPATQNEYRLNGCSPNYRSSPAEHDSGATSILIETGSIAEVFCKAFRTLVRIRKSSKWRDAFDGGLCYHGGYSPRGRIALNTQINNQEDLAWKLKR